MLTSTIASMSSQPQNKNKSSITVNNASTSLCKSIFLHPLRALSVFIILLVYFFIFLAKRTSPISMIISHGAQLSSVPNSSFSEECSSGRIYVYEMPAMFNKDLVGNCDDLDPWHWQCGVATNYGYGRRATEFKKVLPASLAQAWYRTNQFSLEIIYHHRILNYRCRTLEPELATAFYVPFYAGLAVGKYLFDHTSVEQRDLLCEIMLLWLLDQPYWKRFNGSDHFIVLGRITWDFRRLTDPNKVWGSSFLNMPQMQYTTRLTIEEAPADYYDVSVPYPTGFHPHSHSQLVEWQSYVSNLNRTFRTSFVGATRNDIKNDFRGYLLTMCTSDNKWCRLVDCAVSHCSNGSSAILEALLDSDFCLQPRGDSYTRKSIFDCIIAGSIPVFFWKRSMYGQYEWFLLGECDSFSVFIDYDDVMNGTSIREVLDGFKADKITEMKKRVVELIPKIIYAMQHEGLVNNKDAFDIAVEGVLERFKKQRQL